MLETFGGEEMKEALKSAEEISSVLSAVREFGGAAAENDKPKTDNIPVSSPAIAFPLQPVNNIADKDIAYSLSKYIQG